MVLATRCPHCRTTFRVVQDQLKLRGGLVLGMEDTGSRMSRLGKAELVYGEFVTVDEALQRISAVTADQVRDLAAELFSRPRSLAVVGPFDTDPVTSLT